MATSSRAGRDSLPGGLDRYTERSRSRGDLNIERGRDYGRSTNSSKFDDKQKDNTRGDTSMGVEPEKEMHGGQNRGGSGYGGGGDRGYGGGGGYRDRGERGEGGYRDRGGQRDRGGDRGYGGGGGFQNSGPKVSTVAEGANTQMLSNHFKFKTNTQLGNIFIYKIEYGVLDHQDRESRFEALRSIQD